ncbi:MAG: hypothetical protein QF830_14110, partial [Rhodospirillales bacterium]|nr:hypothetical protein [Rhodospirillales bacterium]
MGLRLRSALGDGAERERLWSPAAGAARPEGTDPGQLLAHADAGTPPQVLREFAAGLGLEVSESQTSASGGRQVVVKWPCTEAPLLHGATLQIRDRHCRLAMTHVGGPRRVAAIVHEARRQAGERAADMRRVALEKLQRGEPLVKGKMSENTARLETLQQR